MPQSPAAWPARSNSGGGERGGRSHQPEGQELGAPTSFCSESLPTPNRRPQAMGPLLRVCPGRAWAGISRTAPAEGGARYCGAHRDTPSAWSQKALRQPSSSDMHNACLCSVSHSSRNRKPTSRVQTLYRLLRVRELSYIYIYIYIHTHNYKYIYMYMSNSFVTIICIITYITYTIII